MSRRLTKELILQWLKEAGGWEAGHNELFEYKHWSLGIHKEDDSYQPFTFGVAGHHKGTAETIGRRYRSIEEAMLHVVNGFNENANARNPYASLDEAVNDPLGWLARVNTKISYLYRSLRMNTPERIFWYGSVRSVTPIFSDSHSELMLLICI